MKLSDLVILSAEIEALLVDSQGEITEAIENKLALRDELLPAKVESYAHIMEKMKALQQLYAKKANEFFKVAESCENIVDKLVERVDKAMTEMGVDQFDGIDSTFKRVKNPASLVITDESLIPESLLSIIPARTEPNKQAIKEALKGGEIIPGVELRQTTRIKLGIKKQ